MTMFHPSKHSRAALAALAVGSLALLTACGGSTQSAAGSGSGDASKTAASTTAIKAIAFSPLALKIPAMKGLSEGVKAYGKSKSYSIVVQDPNLDPQKQVTDLQSVIESGRVGGAWAIVIQPSSMSALVKVAQSKKVPLLLNGTPTDYGLSGLQPGLTFDTIDYAAQGKAVGEELGNCINEKLGGKAQVIFGQGAAGSAGKAEIESATKQALAATAPGAKIVSKLIISDRAAAQTDIGNAIQGHPGVKAVLGLNDEGALGAIGAFSAAGKKLPCVTETGGNDEVLKAVKDGKIYAVVALQFQADMAQSFDTLVKMIGDPTATGLQLTVPQKVIKAGS
jgi:ABC-type sugar transport system substrate-binding protein